MALIKCYECSAEISDKASRCPNCGAPVTAHKCSKCGNIISGERCIYCGNSETDVTPNISIATENGTSLDSSDYNQNHQAVKKDKKTKIIFVVSGLLAAVIIIVSFLVTGHLSDDKNKKIKTVDMGAVGNKITVDGTVAYVAGEGKILVPYDFYGNFSECNSAAYSKSLKGCENPQLPTFETDDLPEEVAREIISFYGDAGGFWTSVKASHATMEMAGVKLPSYHYAGTMSDYFRVGKDNVATSVWGYSLEATDDTKVKGLLVLYDVIIDEFEFTDVEDTADPNYSTTPKYYSSVMAESSSEQEQTSSFNTKPDNSIQTQNLINQDFFSDIGATYGELVKKYGRVTETDYYNGGRYFDFEKGLGSYFFEEDNGNNRFTDDNGNKYTPNEEAVCFYAITDLKTLFIGFTGSILISDIEQQIGTSVEVYEDEFDGGYKCSFDYCNCYVSIDCSNEKMISEGSLAFIRLKG